jgi:hypothetical protein
LTNSGESFTLGIGRQRPSNLAGRGTGEAMMMKRVDYDVLNKELLQSLLKNDLKELTPEETSESWEIIQQLYRNKRKKHWLQVMAGTALITATAIVVGVAVYHNLSKPAEDAHQGAGI